MGQHPRQSRARGEGWGPSTGQAHGASGQLLTSPWLSGKRPRDTVGTRCHPRRSCLGVQHTDTCRSFVDLQGAPPRRPRHPWHRAVPPASGKHLPPLPPPPLADVLNGTACTFQRSQTLTVASSDRRTPRLSAARSQGGSQPQARVSLGAFPVPGRVLTTKPPQLTAGQPSKSS